MSDRAVVALALAVVAGAWVGVEVPLHLGAGVTVAALALRRPVLLVVGGGLLASALAFGAWEGLAPPAAGGVGGEVVLLDDPVDVGGAVRVDVGLGRRRAEAWARGQAGDRLRSRLAGERVVLSGALRPVPSAVRARLARRHVSARLSVERVEGWRPGPVASRLANRLRRALRDGAESLGERRALFTGMVVGDDREQSVVVADDFRAAGLTHLLAVSGQNVAMVLALARPALARLGLRARWAATLAVIAFFGLVTRWEPSVLRASGMAALAVTADHLGRPVSRLRLLALAVAAVVLVDPLLVRSLGFQLSVGASAGIILAAGPLARRVPGPRWLADAVAVTVAAQLGVAPVLVSVFGGLPVASLPANLLAGPAAGPVLAWGLTAGLVAGAVGPPIGPALHLPTSALVGWVAGVARWAGELPLGRLRLGHLLALVAVAALVAAGRRHRPIRSAGAGLAVLVVAATALFPSRGPLEGLEVTPGATLWRDGGTVVVVDDPAPGRLLEGLRDQGVARVDVVVSRRGRGRVASTLAILRDRVPVRLVLAPERHRIADAAVPLRGGAVAVGDLRVVPVRTSPTLQVQVRRTGAGVAARVPTPGPAGSR
ncbi:MAG: ComEC/Rec2 family competence protein [Acidimicrobiales bacterium]